MRRRCPVCQAAFACLFAANAWGRPPKDVPWRAFETLPAAYLWAAAGGSEDDSLGLEGKRRVFGLAFGAASRTRERSLDTPRTPPLPAETAPRHLHRTVRARKVFIALVWEKKKKISPSINDEWKRKLFSQSSLQKKDSQDIETNLKVKKKLHTNSFGLFTQNFISFTLDQSSLSSSAFNSIDKP